MTALTLLAVGVVISILSIFVAYLAKEGDARKASEKTSKRAVGVGSGALGSFVVALTVGVEALLQAPELLITLLGIGSIVGGFSWAAFGAAAFTVYVLGEAFAGVRS